MPDDYVSTPPRVSYTDHPHKEAAAAALEVAPDARMAIVVLVLEPEPGDPQNLYPTHFVTCARPGKDMAVAHTVATLRAHAQALEDLEKQRSAGADADKGEKSS